MYDIIIRLGVARLKNDLKMFSSEPTKSHYIRKGDIHEVFH